jgi:hypothetical protein
MQPRARSLSEVVQSPVVTVARDAADAGERGFGIVFQVYNDAGIAAAEILFVPDIIEDTVSLPPVMVTPRGSLT